MSARWSRFCVIGCGGHARTKLIPAILANGQELAAVVSRGAGAGELGVPVFGAVAEAVAALPADTVYVVASPPAVHFEQVLPILEAGRDVIVEKPPFVTERETIAAVGTAERAGTILVDGFMNRHTLTHADFIARCRAGMPSEIACAFTIPEAPPGTFRSNSDLGSSNLYDIGSYVLAALLDIGLPLDALGIDRVDHAGVPDRERVHISGVLDGVAVTAVIGVDTSYANRLELGWANDRTISYQPFFYGRAMDREVITADGTASRAETINDVNAFEAMFAVPPEAWRATAGERGARMIALAAVLERLGRELAAARG